ncbi:hypothetical protein [Streptomyces sp. NPDC001743]
MLRQATITARRRLLAPLQRLPSAWPLARAVERGIEARALTDRDTA